jgi:hypothetical protein
LELGERDDYYTGGPLAEWMLKEVHDKIMSGEYDVFPQAYSNPTILIKDKDANKIDLLKG